MKTQLFAKNTQGETVLLQLSNVDPIKMNLSVAGLDPFNPQSFYSQTFLIPGQGTNGQFFEDVFSVNGTTFNAGVAAQAWINTDGFLFAIGNINLQKVFVDEKYNGVEYEVFFLGDTSDFVQSVGDSYMESINTDELNHELSYANVIESWNATPGGTAGLRDGNVLYPLCEWGYNYDTSNFPTNNTLSIGYAKGSTGDFGGSFTNGVTGPLELTQLKPATRIKWLWDKIFADAGYTYESDFLNSNKFKSMYMISDSEARPFQDIQAGLCRISGPDVSTFVDPDITNRIILNNALDNRDRAFQTVTSQWISPATGTFSFELKGYLFTNPNTFGYPEGAVRVFLKRNGVTIAESGVITTQPVSTPGAAPFFTTFWNLTYTGAFTKDDIVYAEWQQMPYGSFSAVLGGFQFICGDAPDLVVVRSFYPPEGTVSRMDFIKGIATMFNLVFEPSRVSEKSFVIEPWSEWIKGGSQKDWTRLLDASSIMEQEPVFLNRKRILMFTGEDDQDLQNEIYQQQFKKNYGYREYNSNIPVIKDTEEVKVPFAFTPLQSIPNKNTATARPDWVFPTLAKLQPGDPTQNQSGKVQPIQPKPRILFYNGLQSNPIPWYLQQVPTAATGAAQNQYPLVSPYYVFPPGATADPGDPQIELTFKSKTALWSPASTYITPVANDLFTDYWEDWADWIYDPYNRIVRAKFRLDPYDVQTLKFNDKIWVKDSWFFVREIKDYPVGDIALVDVELIKVPDGVIPLLGAPATGPFPGTVCESVAICNNNALLTDPEAYTYVNCLGQEATITLAPQTCGSVCALYPLPVPLPASWSEIRNGDCDNGVFATAGAFIEFFVGASGSTFAQDTDCILYGATGGSAGTFVPMQYFSISGTDNITTTYNVPYTYGARVQLKNRNLGSATVVSSDIVLRVNGTPVASVGITGPYQTIQATFPTGITSGNTYNSSSIIVY
jgi:hypothetical protein